MKSRAAEIQKNPSMKKSLLLLITVCIINATVYCLPSLKSSPNSVQSVRTNLYEAQSNGNNILLDGDLTQYDPSYSNAVDGMDARKMSNFSENIGMLRGTTVLVIERRHTIVLNDSIFYKIWNLHQLTYQLEFVMSNMDQPGLSGYLEDNYLNSHTPLDLNGTNEVKFNVTADPKSYDPSRFRIIFSTAQADEVPLTFTNIKGIKKDNGIQIDWATAHENGLKKYSIERSVNGVNYNTIDSLPAMDQSENNYTWTDNNPSENLNYYRIQSISANGQAKYSDILKVDAGVIASVFKVAPNPVTGNTINLVINNKPSGIYTIKLVNNFGQVLLVKRITHVGGSVSQALQVPSLVGKGVYQLQITGNGTTNVIPLIL